MGAVYWKEIRQYFRSPIGFIFLAVFTFVCGFLFTTGNLLSQNGDIRTFFSSLSAALLFLIPLLTMRQFSEERKQKTQMLLFTLPLSAASVVLGKFLAALSMIGLGLTATLLYPVILGFFGSFALLATLGNYLGTLLLVCMVVALGLYISALTENQIVSGILSYSIVMILWMADSLRPSIARPLLQRVLGVFSLKSNVVELSYGIFNPAAMLYFISMTVLFLLLTTVRLDTRRE